MSKKKKLILLPLLAVMLYMSLAGNSGCGEVDKESAQGKSQKITEQYMAAAIQAVPYPLAEMKASAFQERRQIRERLLRYADPDKISYIYLYGENSRLISHYTVRGKVTHVASQLTQSQTVDDCGADCAVTTDAAMDDGTWGPSEDAIFFFTTDGVLMQWNGPYVLADAPQKLNTAPELVYVQGSKPTSVIDKAYKK